MLAPRFIPFVTKHIVRHRIRSLLTIAGVATAMFLFCGVRAMQEGVRSATTANASETSLIVYRENRYCPFSSRLPEDYSRKIEKIPGVVSAIPMKIVVGNCRASLDVITFRGVPPDVFASTVGSDLKIVEGSVEDWRKRSDAALMGRRVAERRGLKIGDRIEIAGITFSLAGIYETENLQDQESAYTHLEFLQRSSGQGQGIVTQFKIKVSDPSKLDEVAGKVDEMFANAQDPTSTWSEKAFTARAVTDIIELVNFAGWLGWGALAAVFALVANAIILSVQDRIRDHAVLQALGYRSSLIARLIMMEAGMLSLTGGIIGVSIAYAVLHWGQFSLAMEGQTVQANASAITIALGMGLCLILGIGAGLFPAWQASRRQIAACFRTV